MYDFINKVYLNSEKNTNDFIFAYYEENFTYSRMLLESSYAIKKAMRKYKNAKTHEKYKFKSDFINQVSLFSLRLNYTHIVLVSYLRCICVGFDDKHVTFNFISKSDVFKRVFDSTEKEILIKFNQYRNLLVHTPLVEEFLIYTENDFNDLQNFVHRVVELEKLIRFNLSEAGAFVDLNIKKGVKNV